MVYYFYVQIINQSGFAHPSVNAVIESEDDKDLQEKYLKSLDEDNRKAILGWLGEGQKLRFRPRVFNEYGVMLLT